MIRVILADDNDMVRRSLKAALAKAEDIDVVGEATDGQEAIKLAIRLQPDVVIMDITMPRLNGIQAIAQLRRLGNTTEVVILSMHKDEALVQQAFQNGASGYVVKHSSLQELLKVVRAATKRRKLFAQPSIPPTMNNGTA